MQNTLRMGGKYRESIALLAIMLACVFGGLACWGQETSTESSSRTTMKKTGDTTVIDSKSTSTTTTTDGNGTTTEINKKDSSHTSSTKPHVTETDTGYQGGAAKSHEESHSTSVQTTNAKEGELGSTELQNGKTITSGEVGVTQKAHIENGLGTVDAKVTVGANGETKIGSNGGEASGQIGLAAELEAVSNKLGVGDENLGASAQVSAKVKALIGAEGKIGAYIDEHGITIGAQASAGAFVSAEVNFGFEAHVFGIQTNINVMLEGHAGIMAEGEAIVTIGFDGKVKFQLGAGVSIGLGFSADVEFEVDASQLMEQWHLKDLAELIEWLDKFQKDPKGTLDELINNAKDEAVKQGLELVRQVIDDATQRLANWGSGIWNSLTGGGNNKQAPPPPMNTTAKDQSSTGGTGGLPSNQPIQPASDTINSPSGSTSGSPSSSTPSSTTGGASENPYGRRYGK